MPLPDRQKLRREYLQYQAAATVKIESLGLLFYALLLTCLVAIGIIGIVFWLIYQPENDSLSRGRAFGVISLMVLIAAISGGGCFVVRLLRKKLERQAAAIPYVPPFTPDALPAEEVLVRGAEKPISDEGARLLRAAANTVDVPAQELLRAADTETNEKPVSYDR